jgi:hypothetical protein
MKSAGGGFERFNTNFKARVESIPNKSSRASNGL